ncbi:MAG TPA: hypothetical protein VGD97_12935 [Lacunisphaera sp.]
MKPLLRLFVAHAMLIVGGLAAAQEASIAASATAGSDYQRPRDANGALQPETYVFAEGQFLGGGTVDRGLEQTTFTQITRTLAVNLAKQNYLPAPDLKSAQLVIMVHWGMTLVSEDPMKDINLQRAQEALATFSAEQEANGLADPTALNSATSAMGMARQGVQDAVNRNAVLLGFARSLQRERQQMMTSTAEITMSNELNEERYFVILMAYDNQTRLKERRSRLMWVTRLSVRSPGNNFSEALPALARVGADVFGRQVDGLVRVKAPLGRGTVTIGELEVLGQAGEKTPPARKDP